MLTKNVHWYLGWYIGYVIKFWLSIKLKLNKLQISMFLDSAKQSLKLAFTPIYPPTHQSKPVVNQHFHCKSFLSPVQNGIQ
jgi:hypothetical protein